MRLPLLDWLRQDVAYAVRGIVRAPGFAAMVVVTLALGVGANGAVFSLLDRVFGQAPAGVAEPESLRRLYIRQPDNPFNPGAAFPSWNYPAFAAVQDAVGGQASLAAWTPSAETVVRVGDAEIPVRRSYVTGSYFDVLGVRSALGRPFGAEASRADEPAPVVVISHALWESAFGADPAALGRTVYLSDAPYTIVGVAEAGFTGLDLSRTDLFVPVGNFIGSSPEANAPFYRGSGNFFRAVARLEGDTDPAPLEARATAARRGYRELYAELRPSDSDATSEVVFASVIEARGPMAPDPNLSVSTRIAGVTAIVLLIACANVAGLLLMRATRRRRELAVRVALGVSRARLLSQALVESLLLAAVAAVAALFTAAWGGAVLRRLLLPNVEWAAPALDLRVVAFTVGTAFAAGAAAGLVPVLQFRRVDVNASLKADSRQGGRHRSRTRSALLVTQAGLAVVLLMGAGLFVRSLAHVNALDLGYDVHALGAVRLPLGAPVADQDEILARAAARLEALPGVAGVALATGAPMLGTSGQSVYFRGGDSVPELPAGFNSVSPGFFAVAGTEILEGRDFREGELEGAVVVTRSLARRYWPGESALGQCLVLGAPDAPCSEVVGVVEDVRMREVIEEPMLQYFVPLNQPPRSIVIRAEEAVWPQVVDVARAELEASLDMSGVRFTRVGDALEPQLRPWRMGAQLFTAFGLLALLVTLVGVYGVTSYTVSQRTHEMGVRIALGARIGDVLRLVVTEGMGVLLVGVLLGIGAALALGRLVESLLYGVTPSDPIAMAGAAAVLIVAGLVASLVPAWRAAKVDPVRALAAE
jgi:predicted permease